MPGRLLDAGVAGLEVVVCMDGLRRWSLDEGVAKSEGAGV
jgi:hypothetical protein